MDVNNYQCSILRLLLNNIKVTNLLANSRTDVLSLSSIFTTSIFSFKVTRSSLVTIFAKCILCVLLIFILSTANIDVHLSSQDGILFGYWDLEIMEIQKLNLILISVY